MSDFPLEAYLVAGEAKVFEINGNIVKIAYPIELFRGGDMSNIISSVVENMFGLRSLRNLRLLDIILPERLAGSFKSPKCDIEGTRNLLKVYDRTLVAP